MTRDGGVWGWDLAAGNDEAAEHINRAPLSRVFPSSLSLLPFKYE
jgi:hypothetical protein